MLCDFEEINESSCWGNIFSYTRNPWVSGYTVVITLKCSYNLKIFITTCLRSLNYIIILFSLLHRLSLAITKTIVLSTKFTDHQCVITWSILFTSWSSYLRSIWWTVYWKTSPYYRCVAVHAAYGTWSYCYLFIVWIYQSANKLSILETKIKDKVPVDLPSLFVCLLCVTSHIRELTQWRWLHHRFYM